MTAQPHPRSVAAPRVTAALAGLFILVVLAQAAFAGGFAGGHHMWLSWHQKAGIGVLEVQLEERGEFHDRLPGLRGRLAASVRTGEDGIRAWRANPGLDTWITFQSWHHAASDQSDFVPLPVRAGAPR